MDLCVIMIKFFGFGYNYFKVLFLNMRQNEDSVFLIATSGKFCART